MNTAISHKHIYNGIFKMSVLLQEVTSQMQVIASAFQKAAVKHLIKLDNIKPIEQFKDFDIKKIVVISVEPHHVNLGFKQGTAKYYGVTYRASIEVLFDKKAGDKALNRARELRAAELRVNEETTAFYKKAQDDKDRKEFKRLTEKYNKK